MLKKIVFGMLVMAVLANVGMACPKQLRSHQNNRPQISCFVNYFIQWLMQFYTPPAPPADDTNHVVEEIEFVVEPVERV